MVRGARHRNRYIRSRNPTKHGPLTGVVDWTYSEFRGWLEMGAPRAFGRVAPLLVRQGNSNNEWGQTLLLDFSLEALAATRSVHAADIAPTCKDAIQIAERVRQARRGWSSRRWLNKGVCRSQAKVSTPLPRLGGLLATTCGNA